MPTRHIEMADGARLAVTTEGEGPDLLLVTGLGGTAAFWQPTMPSLTDAFRVTRFDQRGIGASSRGGEPCDINLLASDSLAIMDALGIARAVVVGHSTGGAVGQAMGRMAPDRLAGLVLSATWLKPSRYMTLLFTARRRLLDIDATSYAVIGAVLGYAPGWLGDNWHAFDAAIAKPPSSEDAMRVVSERIDALLAFDGSQSASALGCPTLVIGARDDQIVPAFLQEELAAALPPGRQVVMYEDGGHFFPVTRTDDFVRDVVAFAKSLS